MKNHTISSASRTRRIVSRKAAHRSTSELDLARTFLFLEVFVNKDISNLSMK